MGEQRFTRPIGGLFPALRLKLAIISLCFLKICPFYWPSATYFGIMAKIGHNFFGLQKISLFRFYKVRPKKIAKRPIDQKANV